MTTPDGSAGRVLLDYLATQVSTLLGSVDAVASDEPDAVHKARVATRRLRSALATFSPMVDSAVAKPLRAQVRWWGGLLGDPRDAEVLAERLGAAAATLPPDLLPGPVLDRISSTLGDEHAEAHARLVAELGTPRYDDLRAQLNRLVSDPPVTGAARRPASDSLPRALRRTHRAVARELRSALLLDGAARGEAFHEVRKRAKAARYAYDAVVAEFGAPAQQAAGRWEAVTERLGEAQDAAIARRRLDELATAAAAAGEPTFGYGVLVAGQRQAAETAQREGIVALSEALRITAPFSG